MYARRAQTETGLRASPIPYRVLRFWLVHRPPDGRFVTSPDQDTGKPTSSRPSTSTRGSTSPLVAARANTIPGRRAERLVGQVRRVLREAIEAGGSSLRDYVQASGELGYFQHRFAVYDREGDGCVNPGCAAPIKRIVQSGRSTFYCANCQR